MAELAGNGNHRLRPWFIGIAIVVVTDIICAYLFLARTCTAGVPANIVVILLVLVFVVLPAIYLALMYLTLKKQP